MKTVRKNGKTVYVGMSGGVDSSVSAALLKEAGYDVHGVFIKVWTPDFIECTWKEGRLDAMRVCATLGISFETLDLEKEYKLGVVDYMVAEYKTGRTPNPDVMCNRYVKFGGFFDFAMKRGADFVATGHYARIGRGDREDSYTLLAGIDANKDQSYFLWTLTQQELTHTLFPVGGLEKTEVRKLAKKFGLPTAEKKDSQGLCFMGKIDVKEFLAHYLKPKAGAVLNESGQIIGTHKGAFFFTLGERHNFTIFEKTAHDTPYYVVAKDVEKNTITVAHRDDTDVGGNENKKFEIKRMNWISGVAPSGGTTLFARLRYRQPLQQCQIVSEKKSKISHFVHVVFFEKQLGARGQSIVIYDGDVCLGGGIIV